MSKQMLIFLGIVLLAFGSGVAFGLFLGDDVSASDASIKNASSSSSETSSSPEASGEVQANTLLSDRIRELEKELAEQKNDPRAVLADRLTFFKKYQREIGLSAFDNQLKVTPEMAELLGLSKEEQQEIEQHLSETKGEMDKIEDADTVLAKQTATGVTYDIPADPQGKTLKDKLTTLISAEIGGDRAGLFMSHLGYSGDSQFSSFGEQKREIEIAWTQQNGNLVYTTKVNSTGPNGNSSWGMSGTNVQPEYQKYLPTGPAPAP